MSVTTYNSKLEELEQKRIQLKTTHRMLQLKYDEFEETMSEVIEELSEKQKSIKLSRTVQAQLLGISRGHYYNLKFQARNYADLYTEVKRRRPDLLKTLKENFNEYIKK